MSLYIQHGHGKSTKIDDALNAGTVQGVILAPRNEKPENLLSYSTSLRNRRDCQVFVDPQCYISALVPANTRYLTDHSYYCGTMSAQDFTIRRIRTIASDVVDYQINLGVTAIFSPTVLFDSFTDRWYQIALNLAEATMEEHSKRSSPPPLLVSFILSEEALLATSEVDRFLDTVTAEEWNASGFYITIARQEPSYNQDWESERLANLLYIAHILGHINQFQVIHGYTDFLGFVLRAVGASGFATGWSNGLRHFARKNFLQRPPGGQPSRLRYSSSKLLNSIFLQELQDIFELRRLNSVLSGVPLDAIITNAKSPMAAPWAQSISHQHHWETLHQLNQSITGVIRNDVLSVLRKVREANALYTLLEGAGIQFEKTTGKSHLPNWSRAISSFMRRAGIAAP